VTAFPVKKIAYFIIGAAVLLLGIFFTASYVYAPKIAAEISIHSIKILGLETKFLPEPEKKWSSITYVGASFDKEDLSTAKRIDIKYNPFTILFSKRINILNFDHLELLGNWDIKSAEPVKFSGWNLSENINRLSSIPVSQLSFKDAQISVLTPDFGGLALDFSFEGAVNNRKLEFQSHVKSAQKYISFAAGVNGIIARNYINIDLDIDQGKFEVPEANIRASRVFGWLNYSSEKPTGSSLLSELNAGGLTLLNMPWQNATATFEIKDGNLKIYSEAKSTGVEGIELALNLQKNSGARQILFGNLHAEEGKMFTDYLAEQQTITLPADELEKFSRMQDMKIDFLFEKGEPNNKIKYREGGNISAPVHEILIP
jgi:hypothetical protein